MALRCTVCDHPERNAIDSLVANQTASERIIANRYGLTQAAVHRHKQHIPARVAKAVERRENKSADAFLDGIQAGMEAAQQGVKLGMDSAAKVSDEVRYRLAPGFLAQQARYLELLGQATGRLNQSQAPAGNTYISVILPRQLPAQPDQPAAIETTAEVVQPDVPPAQVAESDSEPPAE